MTICYTCGEIGLTWKRDVDGQWRLYDPDGSKHGCNLIPKKRRNSRQWRMKRCEGCVYNKNGWCLLHKTNDINIKERCTNPEYAP